MLHIAGGIILAIFILALLPLIINLLGQAVKGLGYLIVIGLGLAAIYAVGLGMFGVLMIAHYEGFLWLALVGLTCMVTLAVSLKLKWDWGTVGRGIDYYLTRASTARTLLEIQNKNTELAALEAYRTERRRRRAVLLATKKKTKNERDLERMESALHYELDRFTKGTPFEVRRQSDKLRLSIFYADVPIAHVVQREQYYDLLTEDGRSLTVSSGPFAEPVARQIKKLLSTKAK